MQRNQGLTIAAFVAFAAIYVCAQQTFEVTSIKHNTSGDPRSGTRTLPGGRVTVTNLELRQVIRNAYGSNDLDVLGGPDWLDRDRWDINALSIGSRGSSALPVPPLVSIFTAVQEQLGLKLESQRGPVEVVVVDSVERPTDW